MDAWAQQQVVRERDRVVTLKEHLLQTRQLYFNSRRCTHSDVISVVSTVQPVRELPWADDRLRGEEGERAELDSLTKSLYRSPLDNCKRSAKPTVHGLGQLRCEKDSFLAKLEARRNRRTAQEVEAARRIQRVARGWLMRRWLKRNSGKLRLQRKMKKSYQVINQQIRARLELAENAKRAEEYRERAAIKAQSAMRMFLGRRAARKEALVRHVEHLNAAATCICTFVRRSLSSRTCASLADRLRHERVLRAAQAIQSVYRMWFLGKRVVAARRALRERTAAVAVQCFWRSAVARTIVRLEAHRKATTVHVRAAVAIQGMVRGVLSRFRFEEIHSEHDRLVREACALAIQRVARGWMLGRARVRVIRWCRAAVARVWAVIHIQRLVRQRLCWRRVQRLREEKMTDIFYQARIGNRKQVEDLHAIQNCATMEDINGNTVFTVACAHGHKKLARKCLKWGLDINHKNDFGLSGVTLATRGGHAELAELLVSKKAEVSKFGRTLLHDASLMGQEGVVMALLVRDLDPNSPDPTDRNRTALHKAVMQDSKVEVLKLLIENGRALVNSGDDEGTTALHIAASRGLVEETAYLIEAGANVSLEDDAGRTPWRCALLNDHEECAELLKGGWQAIIDHENDDRVDPAETKRFVDIPGSLLALVAERGDKVVLKTRAAMDAGFPRDFQDDDGATLLMLAAAGGAVETMRLMTLDTFEIVDNLGRNVMHYGAHNDQALGLLIKGLSEPWLLLLSSDKDGVTPLHVAASRGVIPEPLFRLAKKAPDLNLDNIVDHVGNTPLHYAALLASEAAVAALLDLGASPTVRNLQGETPLHLMATNPEVDAVSGVTCKQLKDAAGLRNRRHQFPLHLAAMHGCSTLLGLLFALTPDLCFERDAEGLTPFHLAVREDKTSCLGLLLDRAGSSCDHAMLLELVRECARHDRPECAKMLFSAFDSEEIDLDEPLTLAIGAGHERVVALLLRQQPRALAGQTQFELAVQHGHDKVLEAMLAFWESENAFPFQIDRAYLAKVAASSTVADSRATLALVLEPRQHDLLSMAYAATCAGNIECLDYLVKLDASLVDARLEDEKARTLLHVAALRGVVPAVTWLLENGADQNMEDEDGATALMLAKDGVLEYFVDD